MYAATQYLTIADKRLYSRPHGKSARSIVHLKTSTNGHSFIHGSTIMVNRRMEHYQHGMHCLRMHEICA